MATMALGLTCGYKSVFTLLRYTCDLMLYGDMDLSLILGSDVESFFAKSIHKTKNTFFPASCYGIFVFSG